MSLGVVCVWGGGTGRAVWGFLVGWRDQEKEKVVKFLSLLAFFLYPGKIHGCVARKNGNSSESEIKLSLRSIAENLPAVEVKMLVRYRELEICSVSLKISTAFSTLSVYFQKRSRSYWKLQRKGLKMTLCR